MKRRRFIKSPQKVGWTKMLEREGLEWNLMCWYLVLKVSSACVGR